MEQASTQIDPLVVTLLENAGLSRNQTEEIKVVQLGYSDRDGHEMTLLYDRVNTDVQESIKNSGSTRIFHVTGEARVLVDPQAREAIRLNWNHRLETKLVMRRVDSRSGDQPLQPMNAWSMLGGVRSHWNGLTQYDIVHICELASTGALKIYAVDEDPAVHFSLFGSSLVLIQEPQLDQSEIKRIWYLKSAELADILTRNAEQHLYGRAPLHAMEFGTLSAWLTTPDISKIILRSTHHVPFEHLPQDEMRKLQTTGFLQLNSESKRWILQPINAGFGN